MYKNLILSGGIYHDFDQSSQALVELLKPLHIDSVIHDDIEAGLDELAKGDYQLLTVNALRWRMLDDKYAELREQWQFDLSDQGRGNIRQYMQAGGALLGMHTASICFDSWPEWKSILGGTWQWGLSFHPPVGPVQVTVETNHELLRGVSSFRVNDEVYHHLDLTSGVECLLYGEGADGASAQPLLWKHQYGQGRVIYDSLGHDEASLKEANHKQLLQQAVKWLVRQ